MYFYLLLLSLTLFVSITMMVARVLFLIAGFLFFTLHLYHVEGSSSLTLLLLLLLFVSSCLVLNLWLSSYFKTKLNKKSNLGFLLLFIFLIAAIYQDHSVSTTSQPVAHYLEESVILLSVFFILLSLLLLFSSLILESTSPYRQT